MQSWQLISVVLVVGVFAYSFAMRKKLGGKAAAMYSGAMTALQAEVASGRRPDEGEPICVVAVERKLLSSKLCYVALTGRRLVITRAGADTRSFDRAAVQLAIKSKTFADVGNMQTTYSEGWELRVVLPGGEKHVWRVYDQAHGLADHPAHVQALVASLR